MTHLADGEQLPEQNIGTEDAAERRFEELVLEGLGSGEPIEVTDEYIERHWAELESRLKDVRRRRNHGAGPTAS